MSTHNIYFRIFSWRNKKNIDAFGLKRAMCLADHSHEMSYFFKG